MVKSFNFTEALEWLESHTNLEVDQDPQVLSRTPTLERIKKLLDFFQNPQDTAPSIHITGTNGKGSTTSMASSLLLACGLKVGMYTSPDLEEINERIKVANINISDSKFKDVLNLVRHSETHLKLNLTRFEILTACAFLHFADEASDANVVEVGLGGTWDATNVVNSMVPVITNVSLDHERILGPTTIDIARDKSGIFKEGAQPIIGPVTQEVAQTITERAFELGSLKPLFYGQDFKVINRKLAYGGYVASFVTPSARYEDIYISLHGSHQIDNAILSLVAVESFFKRPLDEVVVNEVFSDIKIPGRLEVVSRNPLVILDGAHNPGGAKALSEAIANEFAFDGIILLTGLLKDKNADSFFKELGSQARIKDSVKEIILTSPPSKRAQDTFVLKGIAKRNFPEPAFKILEDPKDAVEYGLERLKDGDLFLVCGSLYLVGAVRAFIIFKSRGGL